MDAQISATNRSKITNGVRHHVRPVHGGPDMRTRSGRRWRDLLLAFSRQLGHEPRPAESALLRSAADLQLAAERLSAEIASGNRGGAADEDRLISINGSLRHTLRQLGLGSGGGERRAPSLGELMGDSR
ncbi:MAG: hypothetical protein ACREJ5_17100 [Geminicoccaceae bacterium]